jgi:DNA repair ATPase RecN
MSSLIYDDILKEMDDIEDRVDIDDTKITVFRDKKLDISEHNSKLDLILNEMKDLKIQVKELQNVVNVQSEHLKQQSEHLENIEKTTDETKRITYNSYKKLEEMNKGSFYSTLADFACPILGSVGLSSASLVIGSATKFNKIYKFW